MRQKWSGGGTGAAAEIGDATAAATGGGTATGETGTGTGAAGTRGGQEGRVKDTHQHDVYRGVTTAIIIKLHDTYVLCITLLQLHTFVLRFFKIKIQNLK